MGQVTFLQVCSERYFPMEGAGAGFREYFARVSNPLGRLCRFFPQPLFLCGLSRDILWGFLVLAAKRSLHLWNGPRLGTKRLTSTAKSAPTPTPSSNRSVRRTSTLAGVRECA